MRRSFIGLVAVALLLAGGAGTSRAAPGAVQHFRFHGAVAEAAWARTVGTDFVGAYVQVAEAKDASELVAEQFHERYDEHGTFLGATIIHAAVPSGYAFVIHKARLDSASVTGNELPATRCRFDANMNPIGECTHTTMSLTAAWAGEGLIARAVTNDRRRYHGFSVAMHANGTERNATATGTVNGVPLADTDFLFAGLSTNNYGTATICLHAPC